MRTGNTWGILGTITLFLGGLGHFIVVDLSAIYLETKYVHWNPHPLIGVLKTTAVTFDLFGGNNAFYIFSGFSIWVTISLILFGFFNVIILRNLRPGEALRQKFMYMNLVVAVAFSAVAVICYIPAAALGGIIAVLCFGMASLNERRLRNSPPLQ